VATAARVLLQSFRKFGLDQRHREWRVPAFRRIQNGLLKRNVRANACAAALFGRTVDFKSRDDF
jgi:hypothetical protein